MTGENDDSAALNIQQSVPSSDAAEVTADSLAHGDTPGRHGHGTATPASHAGSVRSVTRSDASMASPGASVLGELAAIRAENEALLAALEESEERAAQLESEVREEVSREMEERIQEI